MLLVQSILGLLLPKTDMLLPLREKRVFLPCPLYFSGNSAECCVGISDPGATVESQIDLDLMFGHQVKNDSTDEGHCRHYPPYCVERTRRQRQSTFSHPCPAMTAIVAYREGIPDTFVLDKSVATGIGKSQRQVQMRSSTVIFIHPVVANLQASQFVDLANHTDTLSHNIFAHFLL